MHHSLEHDCLIPRPVCLTVLDIAALYKTTVDSIQPTGHLSSIRPYLAGSILDQ
ncbi:hypothetical protein AG1IA_10055 [Rhizoctonia solani AG-1 IA]|uniref:Uncharacterized protein n=1 Tax=Thanatephorus cucumeris (strain AG1-IA) TaxID=983506 RepID=L8WD80_THACA|nr:hypothetical protein AG1IA_10055 [Rhizoctonia solani AG-1 IA]